ncbi:uncharacterized protein CC84DRAFT_179746 [Paraphaeosphaeria sporulosa]|uniref:Uncharacterized protein n=1 Tax=Paraphaeosphaeria sporulosa TaxID=1460663 RepID=A0A177D1N0_9PLEO|nr:uncharacterized protein CC84DRAFT_179746 [Paraphaeosphaeria sporulosa]OAG13082.1 hypothetical protein CC84DRAFT_179746 [Paraphaeosphaeria sporulosa]
MHLCELTSFLACDLATGRSSSRRYTPATVASSIAPTLIANRLCARTGTDCSTGYIRCRNKFREHVCMEKGCKLNQVGILLAYVPADTVADYFSPKSISTSKHRTLLCASEIVDPCANVVFKSIRNQRMLWHLNDN